MKDTLRILAKVIVFLFSVNIFALGIGPSLDFSTGTDFCETEPILQAGVSCSIKTDNIPLVFDVATDFNFYENDFALYETCDYWLFNPEIGDYAYFFAGFGEKAGILFSADDFYFNVAPRAVFGLNWIFYDGFLEYFAQVAVEPNFLLGSENDFYLNFPLNIGVRFYF